MKDKPTTPPHLLTKAQAADYLGLSERTLSRHQAEGIGPPRVKLKGKVLYLEQSLLDWLKRLESHPVRG